MVKEKQVKPFGINVLILGNRCSRCGYEWKPRLNEPAEVCPQCKSPYWAKAKVKNSGRFPKRENWK
ncbi:MAG TPA: hypothetical protein P5530_01195 [Candidatus Diapherotrites archaeon]|nr:hypothetical protein [Candidatus Diapherotrites archaeon]